MVIELAVVVLLAGFPIDFPRDVSAGRAWSFLFRHPSILIHAVIGALALTEAVIFVVRTTSARRPRLLILSCLGLFFVLVAFGAGTEYVSGGQHDLALNLMTLGWVAALVVYIVGWVLGRRGMRAERPRVAGQ
ncbi:hypothetical protein MPTA5024_29750 [Microbispora sp. ATCC PTA-5024]|nr:hypothetical protein MPTA5024_29750 [Microbispora sp. ATCC PTA-5024]